MTDFNELRILVIDDNPQIHNDFIKILTSNTSNKKKELDSLRHMLYADTLVPKISLPSFQIDTAIQGKEGVAFVDKAIKDGLPYALAFVDIRMPPGWDGLETIKRIWNIDNDIQIVICTAYSDYSWEDTVECLGERDNLLILKKPFDILAVRQLSMALTKKWKLLKNVQAYMHELEHNVVECTKQLEDSLFVDSLTQLPNRESLHRYMMQEISKARRTNHQFAVLVLNLDRFNMINDSFSDAVGDELLTQVAERLKSSIHPKDFIARRGGDEFVIILSDCISMSVIQLTLDHLVSSFKQTFSIAGHQIIVMPSIGLSVYPDTGSTVEELLRNATSAMYHAKKLGGGQTQRYNSELNQNSLIKLELETDLYRALEKNQFILYFQPQFTLDDHKLISVEALIRWQHPSKGILLPIEFIPLAEEIGIISSITSWVIRTACQQNKKWQLAGLPPIRMAVNLSAKEFLRQNLVSTIKSILNETGLTPEYLEIELSENMIVNDVNSVKNIDELKSLGVSIAIDDFGSGYSSLNHLRSLQLNRLKIDQSFIRNIDVSQSDEVIIQAIITMAKSLGLEVLAEGVETQNQVDFLRSRHCDEVQGYYFSHPLEASEIEKMYKKNRVNNDN